MLLESLFRPAVVVAAFLLHVSICFDSLHTLKEKISSTDITSFIDWLKNDTLLVSSKLRNSETESNLENSQYYFKKLDHIMPESTDHLNISNSSDLIPLDKIKNNTKCLKEIFDTEVEGSLTKETLERILDLFTIKCLGNRKKVYDFDAGKFSYDSTTELYKINNNYENRFENKSYGLANNSFINTTGTVRNGYTFTSDFVDTGVISALLHKYSANSYIVYNYNPIYIERSIENSSCVSENEKFITKNSSVNRNITEKKALTNKSLMIKDGIELIRNGGTMNPGSNENPDGVFPSISANNKINMFMNSDRRKFEYINDNSSNHNFENLLKTIIERKNNFFSSENNEKLTEVMANYSSYNKSTTNNLSHSFLTVNPMFSNLTDPKKQASMLCNLYNTCNLPTNRSGIDNDIFQSNKYIKVENINQTYSNHMISDEKRFILKHDLKITNLNDNNDTKSRLSGVLHNLSTVEIAIPLLKEDSTNSLRTFLMQTNLSTLNESRQTEFKRYFPSLKTSILKKTTICSNSLSTATPSITTPTTAAATDTTSTTTYNTHLSASVLDSNNMFGSSTSQISVLTANQVSGNTETATTSNRNDTVNIQGVEDKVMNPVYYRTTEQGANETNRAMNTTHLDNEVTSTNNFQVNQLNTTKEKTILISGQQASYSASSDITNIPRSTDSEDSASSTSNQKISAIPILNQSKQQSLPQRNDISLSNNLTDRPKTTLNNHKIQFGPVDFNQPNYSDIVSNNRGLNLTLSIGAIRPFNELAHYKETNEMSSDNASGSFNHGTAPIIKIYNQQNIEVNPANSTKETEPTLNNFIGNFDAHTVIPNNHKTDHSQKNSIQVNETSHNASNSRSSKNEIPINKQKAISTDERGNMLLNSNTSDIVNSTSTLLKQYGHKINLIPESKNLLFNNAGNYPSSHMILSTVLPTPYTNTANYGSLILNYHNATLVKDGTRAGLFNNTNSKGENHETTPLITELHNLVALNQFLVKNTSNNGYSNSTTFTTPALNSHEVKLHPANFNESNVLSSEININYLNSHTTEALKPYNLIKENKKDLVLKIHEEENSNSTTHKTMVNEVKSDVFSKNYKQNETLFNGTTRNTDYKHKLYNLSSINNASLGSFDVLKNTTDPYSASRSDSIGLYYKLNKFLKGSSHSTTTRDNIFKTTLKIKDLLNGDSNAKKTDHLVQYQTTLPHTMTTIPFKDFSIVGKNLSRMSSRLDNNQYLTANQVNLSSVKENIATQQIHSNATKTFFIKLPLLTRFLSRKGNLLNRNWSSKTSKT